MEIPGPILAHALTSRRILRCYLSGFAKDVGNHHLWLMLKAFEFCIPTTGTIVPAGPEWLHEIKYDGFRLRVERDGDRVRLFTRGGYDWTKRYPWIVEAALKNRQKRFVLDGEAVILGVDGISDFNALHSGTMRKCSSVLSTCWQWTVTTCAICHCRCAKPISPGYWRVDLTASS